MHIDLCMKWCFYMACLSQSRHIKTCIKMCTQVLFVVFILEEITSKPSELTFSPFFHFWPSLPSFETGELLWNNLPTHLSPSRSCSPHSYFRSTQVENREAWVISSFPSSHISLIITRRIYRWGMCHHIVSLLLTERVFYSLVWVSISHYYYF